MKSKIVLLFVITLVVCLTQFAADIYAPALPHIAVDLQTPVDRVQWSLAIYLLGVTLTTLIYGPLSDGIGRKIPLSVGLFIFLVGTFVCLTATGIQSLIYGRLIQGCGAGACVSLWRAIFRDLFVGDELAKYGSYLVIFIMFIVPAAPVLGAYLQEGYGWRSNFVFMCGYGLVALLSILFSFKETSQHHHLEKLKPISIFKTYALLLKNPLFMGVTFCTFLTYGAFFSWFVTGPVLLIKHLGISTVSFGWISFLGGGSAYALAGWLNGRFVKRFGAPTIMRFGWSVTTLAGVSMLFGYFYWGLNSLSIILPVILFYFGSTFIWPNAFAIAFTPFGKIAGYAGALYGSIQLGGGAVLGGLMSYLPDHNQLPLACVFLVASICAWFMYELVT